MVFFISLKRLLPYWFIALIFLLLFSACGPSRTLNYQSSDTNSTHGTQLAPMPTISGTAPPIAPEMGHFIDTWNNIHSFLTFDYNISNAATVAKHYDFVWGASVNHIVAFRSSNPHIFLTYYLPFNRDHGTFSTSGEARSLSYWKTFHPDWILYQCDRVTPAYEFGDPNIPLDFANPAFVAWQIQTYALPASMRGYDGIAADNVDLHNLFGACGVYKNGQWVQRYTGQDSDPQWNADVITWLTRMQQALHQLRHPLALIPNTTLSNLSPTDPLVQQYLSHVDGILDEQGFTRAGDGYQTGSDWVQTIQLIESMQLQNKPYYIINQFPSVSHADIQWAVASYLMCKEHRTALFISTIQGYGNGLWYNEYNVQIGNPTGPMYQTQNVYERDYSHGLSIVNPSPTESYIVTLGLVKHYRDLYGNTVSQTIMMPPHSGIVLVTNS